MTKNKQTNNNNNNNNKNSAAKRRVALKKKYYTLVNTDPFRYFSKRKKKKKRSCSQNRPYLTKNISNCIQTFSNGYNTGFRAFYDLSIFDWFWTFEILGHEKVKISKKNLHFVTRAQFKITFNVM